MKPHWYPNWKGETCAIIASGPSIKDMDLEPIRLKGIKCIAINNNFFKVPWADVLYACDVNWWRTYPQAVTEFKGLKITQDKTAQDQFGIHRVICERHHENLVMDRPGQIGWGGNSGFHCINLCAQWGVKKIILVGYDMNLDSGTHWHGDHINNMNNPTKANVARWCRTIDANANKLAELGITVINTSLNSSLRQFKKMSLAEALND